MRGARGALLVVAVVAAAATASCSLLIGVSGDPVVVDVDGGNTELEAGVEGGDAADSPTAQDAADADDGAAE